MQDKDIEYEKMLEYWTEIHRANYVYVPTRGDEIDKRLAEYINKSDLSRKSKCLFVREQEGVYSYFFKKVIMKLEENNLIIRVGGGFMSVDEFIEINNPLEQSRKLSSQASILRASNQSVSNMQGYLNHSASQKLNSLVSRKQSIETSRMHQSS